MKILIKGGVWKNTEDEILKAAVMKYGKNQWARVASLLSRKSAAQCKARWYEWLDPNIKKTEWTKEEEEKLLILAKTLPMQWRTIAPLVGRTPMQCLEHYDKLIDKAMGRTDTENIRLLRPGEIDPNPETKPARPDPIDMDDDEKEMLSEARARLASTKGKKAKRKAREKQMEEAKRLSTTQKRRELKAAGIDIRYKQYKKKRELDNYNNEIPFARAIPAGVYDISEELKPSEIKPFQPVTVAELEDRNRDEEEIKAIERDKQRFKRLQQTNPIDAIMQINNVTSDQQLRKRRKLNLPEPVLNDSQLIEMVKSGSQNEVLRSGNQLTSGLLGAGATPSTLRPSIGRTPLRSDILMQEARNIAKIQELQTPLLPRQEIKLEAGLNKTGLTPLISNTGSIMQTPSQISSTPNQVNATPFRDSLGLNDKEWDNRTNNQNKLSKLQIEQQLNNLPAPQNEYTLKTPTLPKPITEEMQEEDAEVTNRLRLIEQARLDELEYNRRSQVLKRDLPRPTQLNTEKILLLEDSKSIDYMILEETVSLVLEDNKNYPIKITKNSTSTTKDFIKHLYTDEELAVAKALIDSEIDDVKKLMTECYGDISYQDFVSLWTQHNNRILYLSGKKSFAFIDKLPQADIIQSHQYLFNMYKSEMEILTKKIQKLENIVNVLLQGYIKVNENLNKELNDIFTEYDNKIIELKCYQQLMSMEDQAMTIRKTIIDGDLKEQKEKEHILQQRYTDLLREKDALFRA